MKKSTPYLVCLLMINLAFLTMGASCVKSPDGQYYNFRLDGETIANALTGKGNRWDGPGFSSGGKNNDPPRPSQPRDPSLINPGKYASQNSGKKYIATIKKQNNKNFPYILTIPYEFEGEKPSTQSFSCYQNGRDLICPEDFEDLDLKDDQKRYISATQISPTQLTIEDHGVGVIMGGSGGGLVFPTGTLSRIAK